MSDSEYEYEEESSYVTFDMGRAISSSFVEQKARAGCRIVGMEEGRPLLQLGGLTFEGTVDETIGTHLLFEIKEKVHDTKGLLPLLTSMRTEDDAPKQQKYSAEYFCSTENTIRMDTVTIRPREPVKETPKLIDEDEEEIML
ncbi:swr complex subunit [Mucor velutinosus]|uniref:Swr complex subunit n=1 Tax=Mucor velutinosus TaxID=708070 RepID=A0AAN7DCB3_9FUNG|nr:swr complex subunit [Mucor velutinosus]